MTERGLLHRFARCRRGASAVEFAIVAIPFFMLLFGTIEYGRAMWIREAINETAAAGARCVGVVQSQCAGSGGKYDAVNAVDFVRQTANDWYVTLTSKDIAIDTSASCSGVPGFSRVTIAYTFQSAVPTFIHALSGGIPFSASACFPNQNQSASG